MSGTGRTIGWVIAAVGLAFGTACAALPLAQESGPRLGSVSRLNLAPGSLAKLWFPYYVHLSAEGERAYLSWIEYGEGGSSRDYQDLYFSRSVDGGAAWEKPRRLEARGPDEGRALYQDLVGDGRGNLYLAWAYRHVKDHSKKWVFFRHSPDGGQTWGEAQGVNPSSLSAFQPKVAADDRGRVYVIWYDERARRMRTAKKGRPKVSSAGSHQIYIQSSADQGKSWPFPDQRLDEAEGRCTETRILTGPQGEVYAAWHQTESTGTSLQFRRSNNGGKDWSPPRAINDGEVQQQVFHSTILRGPGEDLYALWATWDVSQEAFTLTFDASRDGGRTWGKDRTLSLPSKRHAIKPHAAADGERLFVVWQARDGDKLDVYFLSSADGGRTWSEKPIRLNRDRDYQGYAMHPRVAADGRGGVYAVWESTKEAVSHVYLSYSRDHGKSWSEVFRVDPDVKDEAHHPQAVALGPGRVGVAWEGWTEKGQDLYFRRVDVGP